MPRRIGVSLVILVSALVSLEFPQWVFAQRQDAQDKPSQEDVIRRRVDLVSVYFTVRDNKKRLVSDLPEDQFILTEDGRPQRSEEHTSELQSRLHLVCRLLLEKKQHT